MITGAGLWLEQETIALDARLCTELEQLISAVWSYARTEASLGLTFAIEGNDAHPIFAEVTVGGSLSTKGQKNPFVISSGARSPMDSEIKVASLESREFGNCVPGRCH